MRIWIDGQCLQTASKLRGIGRYVIDFIAGMATHEPRIELSISFNAALADEALAARTLVSRWIPNDRVYVWEGLAEGGEANFGYSDRRKLSEIAVRHHAACLTPDLALSVSPFEGQNDLAVPFLPAAGGPARSAAIFYDAIPYRFPDRYLSNAEIETYYRRRLKAYADFDLVLAISDFSRREAEALLPGRKAVSIHAGMNEAFVKLVGGDRETWKHSSPVNEGDYLLYVGALDWRKNVGQVVNAFALLPPDLRENLRFILAGETQTALTSEISKQWREKGLPPANLEILGYLRDAELAKLYRNAQAVIQPSRMEGFGLTALEAMSAGVPVIASSTGALPEVIGMPELLFDPEKPGSIAACIARIATDRTLVEKAVQHGLHRASAFTWKKTAARAAEAFASIIGNEPPNRSADLIEHRLRTRRQITGLSLSNDMIAQALAVAEPVIGSPRLLVEVTATARIDHKTGIQRVVNNISNFVQDMSPIETQLAYCDAVDGFYEVARPGTAGLRFAGKREAGYLGPRANDIVLMLDSSWEFRHVHKTVLLEARLRGARVVATLYDLIPVRTSAFCRHDMPPLFTDWFTGVLVNADAFVCISKAVADELIALLTAIRFPRPIDIGYWRLGADFHHMETIGRSLKTESPVYLIVGTIEPRKGHAVALEAFDKLWQGGFKGSLVLVGRPGWGTDHFINRVKAHPENNRCLHWRSQASDGELQSLYDQCHALIAPSYAEGFGLPIVEAAAHGKPVIASDIPVFREIASETAMFFEVGSADALAARILEQAGETRASRPAEAGPSSWITWNQSAQELADVVVNGKWYRTYEPPADDASPSSLYPETLAMRRRLVTDERLHRLELVETAWIEHGEILKTTVRLSNLSAALWSPLSSGDGDFRVNLGYRILDVGGAVLQRRLSTRSIPFVVVPSDQQYLSVDISAADLPKTAAAIEIEMIQGEQDWWGEPLRFPIPRR